MGRIPVELWFRILAALITVGVLLLIRLGMGSG